MEKSKMTNYGIEIELTRIVLDWNNDNEEMKQKVLDLYYLVRQSNDIKMNEEQQKFYTKQNNFPMLNINQNEIDLTVLFRQLKESVDKGEICLNCKKEINQGCMECNFESKGK